MHPQSFGPLVSSNEPAKLRLRIGVQVGVLWQNEPQDRGTNSLQIIGFPVQTSPSMASTTLCFDPQPVFAGNPTPNVQGFETCFDSFYQNGKPFGDPLEGCPKRGLSWKGAASAIAFDFKVVGRRAAPPSPNCFLSSVEVDWHFYPPCLRNFHDWWEGRGGPDRSK